MRIKVGFVDILLCRDNKMSENQQEPTENVPKKHLCPKFIAAGVISSSALVFGGTMLVLAPTGVLAPFYASLVSASLAYWLNPPAPNAK